MDPLAHVEQLLALADALHELGACSGGGVRIQRSWCDPARTFTYHTHVSTETGRRTLDLVSDAFFRAAELPEQPWYAQFRGGACRPCAGGPPPGILRRQLAVSSFDVGLAQLRCYHQLVCEAAPREDARVVSLLSAEPEAKLPDGQVVAHTLAPTGDVFVWREERLHWHHICTTPGVGLLPGRLDRWLLNGLRRCGLDGRERATYRDEALAWQRWVAGLGDEERAEP